MEHWLGLEAVAVSLAFRSEIARSILALSLSERMCVGLLEPKAHFSPSPSFYGLLLNLVFLGSDSLGIAYNSSRKTLKCPYMLAILAGGYSMPA